MPDPVLQLYRSIHFSYDTGLDTPSNVCQCPCSTGTDADCKGLDALVHGGSHFLFTDHPDGKCASHKNNGGCGAKNPAQNAWQRRCPKSCDVLSEPKYNKPENSHPCLICRDITKAISQMLTRNDVNQLFLQRDSSAFQSFQAGVNVYKEAKAKSDASIRQAIAALEQKRAHFEAQAAKIRALKDKVRVATEVLHSATGKLSGMGTSFNTLEQQNSLQYKDRVPVGIPYLPPFFTLSNRNFVVMMVCINVLLLVGIIVYAFVGRIRTDADVVATRETETTSVAEDESTLTAPAPAPAQVPVAPVESDSSSSMLDEPEAEPSDTGEDADASTSRARGGRRTSSPSRTKRRMTLSAGTLYAN